MTKKRTLEIDEDLAFQKREWLAQRIGIGLLALFVIAAALGFTGLGGPLNHAEAGERGGPIHVEYERVVRRGAKTSMKLNLRTDPPGFIQFWVSAPYLENVVVDGLEPAPQTVTVESERHVYTIRAGSTDVTVTVEVQPQTFGRLEGEAGIVGGPSVRFQQVSLF